MKQILAITRKELNSYFGSPMALIFLGAFLAVTLFAFFWVETFFARGIADVRPLFRWMPLLLIFLVAALTMRQWSEEQRSGTLEMLLTLPVRPAQLVIGKFLAVMTMVLVALMLTLPLPITVASSGQPRLGAGARRLSGGAAAGRRLQRHRPVRLVAHRQSDRGVDRDGAAGGAVLPDRHRRRDRFCGRRRGRSLPRDRHEQPLREHRARRDRSARSGLLPLADGHLPDAQRLFARTETLEHGRNDAEPIAARSR